MERSTGGGGGRGGEHRVRITAHGAGPGNAAAPEKQLNGFVRLVALIERVGNALGTLAFTWATVVLLGGYPTALRPDNDFWFATTIVFLEAASQELRELTAEILRNLAMDGNIREEIGHIRVIISRLLHAFLSRCAPSSTDSDQLLRMIAGQALAVLTMESANNCLVMLAEPGYVFIKELTIMIHSERYRYIAASLLRNMCMHARPELSNSDQKELCHILREVLKGIMDAEGAELEILVGLSSQICNVIPDDFAREVEHGQIKERFIKRLVNALNSNMIPTANCPGIRRVIVEHAIYMIECNPRYVNCFNKCWMMEALLMVERTPSRAENYRFFLGDAGFMEHSIPLSALVARAKELMGREWPRGFSSVT